MLRSHTTQMPVSLEPTHPPCSRRKGRPNEKDAKCTKIRANELTQRSALPQKAREKNEHQKTKENKETRSLFAIPFYTNEKFGVSRVENCDHHDCRWRDRGIDRFRWKNAGTPIAEWMVMPFFCFVCVCVCLC